MRTPICDLLGIDIVVPDTFAGEGQQLGPEALRKMVPDAHGRFVADLLTQHGIEASAEEVVEASSPTRWECRRSS
ncbi:hypothetical protein LWP59_16330 [Amycolatopsis acidiphila]|uniref:Uncharacterized protein n=1 Tax=Amycolatopsis acidiphila TaxID=715473 RepID=A0A557ZYS5_9PSEU|nr:hypothetical protein [Amycolatopsis acidiphila]TVT17159.1 hypothetical protein FNH06_32405 [Amycolatopsis acidiphila]UIJ63083.1 hypothetical protein LWP59_16330 [Amycolatopsis acidiphila]GHG66030.1 hypothetical protein GCM10017788_23990 [Amycolatopsis acidiphila]